MNHRTRRIKAVIDGINRGEHDIQWYKENFNLTKKEISKIEKYFS